MRVNKTFSTAMMLVVLVATWVKPLWPAEQAMHSSLTIVALGLLWWQVTQHGMQDGDFFAIMLFLCMHSIAARWLYSNVPYDRWWQALFGWSLDHSLGSKRNSFDRLVHFLYGFCFAMPIMSYLKMFTQWPSKWRGAIAVAAVMLSSLVYEWFEWLVAISLSAQDAESYNGQQGDIWDAHKDMLMATIGSLLAWVLRSMPWRLAPKFASK
jgi:putative membrane protein